MGYRGQRQSSYGSQHVSGRTVAGIQNNRSLNAKLVDASLKAPLAKSEEQWMNAPNRYDLPDVDTPKESKIQTVSVEPKLELPKAELPKPSVEGSTSTYNKATGWLSITFDSIPSFETRQELKSHGFRYVPYDKRWRASFNLEREDVLKKMSGKIESIDIKPNWASKAEHASDLAAKHEGIADELLDKRHKLLQVVQDEPIHVGHHSEKHHGADLAKMERWTEKAVEEHNLSKELSRKAERYGKLATGESPVTIHNRIKKLEAEKRSLQRQLLGDVFEIDGKFYRRKGSDPSPERKEEIRRWIAHCDSRLEVEQEKYKASGGLPTDSMVLKVGDVVDSRFGKFKISKINEKTVLGRFVGSDEHLNFGLNHRKIDKTDITEKIG